MLTCHGRQWIWGQLISQLTLFDPQGSRIHCRQVLRWLSFWRVFFVLLLNDYSDDWNWGMLLPVIYILLDHNMIIQTSLVASSIYRISDAGRWKKLGVHVVKNGQNLHPFIGIGITEKIRGASAPPPPPGPLVPASLQNMISLTVTNIIAYISSILCNKLSRFSLLQSRI